MDKRVIIKTETEIEVLKIIKQRWLKGRKEYGKGINYDQQKTNLGWLNNAIEEAADLLQYLVAFKMKIIKEKEKNDG